MAIRLPDSAQHEPGQLRVGYINIEGLTDQKWQLCRGLLAGEAVFDLLFVAETWWMAGWHAYETDPCWIACSSHPSSINPKPLKPGRKHGGIFLLGTPRAKRLVLSGGAIQKSEYYVSVSPAPGLRVSGVYWPPSLADDAIQAELATAALSASDLVLGDINVRFPALVSQRGALTPEGRRAILTSWMTLPPRDMRPLEPTTVRALGDNGSSGLGCFLNLIHCLTTLALHQHTHLRLLRNDTIARDGSLDGLNHHHMAHVTVNLRGMRRQRRLLLPSASQNTFFRHPFEDHVFLPTRFSVSKMRPAIQHLGREGLDLLVDAAVRTVYQPAIWNVTQTVDVLNDAIIKTIHHIAIVLSAQSSSSLPPKPSFTSSSSSSSSPPLPCSAPRLLKTAMRSSVINTQILPPEGVEKDPLNLLRSRLARRYTAPRGRRLKLSALLSPGSRLGVPLSLRESNLQDAFSLENVLDELQNQVAEKACGGDGVHTFLLKALANTHIPRLLARLFRRCAATGHTPRAWGMTEICLTPKDPASPRTPDNLRPVTLESVMRKLFERLLLRTVSGQCWTALDPAQAGFRAGYSVETNAALVHHALSSGASRVAVFVDIKSAFDMVDHALLLQALHERLCGRPVLRLLVSLMLANVSSRVLVNGRVSLPFRRTRGLQQGSPLSPLLFNIYLDGLISRLNRQQPQSIPPVLFYADDGALLAPGFETAQRLLLELQAGLRKLKLRLSPPKCKVVTSLADGAGKLFLPLTRNHTYYLVKVRETTYLGFPTTAQGINFVSHVTQRMEAAAKLAAFLSLHSDGWGVSGRLDVYRRYLAPMFEYGGALVFAWAKAERAFTQFDKEVDGLWRRLLCWVCGCKIRSPNIAANVLGLVSLRLRFSYIHAKFQRVRAGLDQANPLSTVLLSAKTPFSRSLRSSALYDASLSGPPIIGIDALVKRERRTDITRACRGVLLSASPVSLRAVPRFFLADNLLAAPAADQKLLLSYRLNLFGCGRRCLCGSPFRRTHIDKRACFDLPWPVDEAAKRAVFGKEIDLDDITRVDYWIVKKDFVKAMAVLHTALRELGVLFSDRAQADLMQNTTLAGADDSSVEEE